MTTERPKRKREESLGNAQCPNCLHIFPVKGTLPKDVECPRCGAGIHLEWKGKDDES